MSATRSYSFRCAVAGVAVIVLMGAAGAIPLLQRITPTIVVPPDSQQVDPQYVEVRLPLRTIFQSRSGPERAYWEGYAMGYADQICGRWA